MVSGQRSVAKRKTREKCIKRRDEIREKERNDPLNAINLDRNSFSSVEYRPLEKKERKGKGSVRAFQGGTFTGK